MNTHRGRVEDVENLGDLDGAAALLQVLLAHLLDAAQLLEVELALLRQVLALLLLLRLHLLLLHKYRGVRPDHARFRNAPRVSAC